MKTIQEPEYVEDRVPALRMMLGDNVKNITWAARVLIAMTAYFVVQDIVHQELSLQLRQVLRKKNESNT